MAYKGDTINYRISSPNGTYKTVDSLEEVDGLIDQLVNTYGAAWAAVDKIETTRIMVRKPKDTE